MRRHEAVRALAALIASLALSSFIVQVWQSRGDTSELLQRDGRRQLGPAKVASPFSFWGLGSWKHAQAKWKPMPYRDMVQFRQEPCQSADCRVHLGAKLIALKPTVPAHAGAVEQPAHVRLTTKMRRWDRGHDLSESVTPDSVMGTHFIASPEHPAGQNRKSAVEEHEKQFAIANAFDAPTHVRVDMVTTREHQNTGAEYDKKTWARKNAFGSSEPRHDLSESVTPDSVMGTHFIASPEHPAGQNRKSAVEEHEKQFAIANAFDAPTHVRVDMVTTREHQNTGAEYDKKTWARKNAFGSSEPRHDLSESVTQDSVMGTHFIVSPDHPAAQSSSGRRKDTTVSDMGTLSSPTLMTHEPRHAEQESASAAARPDVPVYVHSSDEPTSEFGTNFLQDRRAAAQASKQHAFTHVPEAAEMGTHFLESPEDSYAKTQHLLRPEDQVGISPYAMRREQGDERHVLSPEDAVGETSYVVPTEGRAEEAGGHASAAFVLNPEDQVGDVEYSSDASSYHAGTRARGLVVSQSSHEAELPMGTNFVAGTQGKGFEPRAAQTASPGPTGVQVQSSDGAALPMGTNFVASKQGEGFDPADRVVRAKPFQSDFPLPWSGTNSVFIGSHQGGDPTFSHETGEGDAAPGTINTLGRGSRGGFRPSAQRAPADEQGVARGSVAPRVADATAPQGGAVRGADDGAVPVVQQQQRGPLSVVDQKRAYYAQVGRKQVEEAEMMMPARAMGATAGGGTGQGPGAWSSSSSLPCSNCVPKGGPAS